MTIHQIEPQILATIKDLPFLARKVTNNFLAGLHRSAFTEMGLEFSEYRSYQPGDDLRFIDWKMFARSDRYFVRQSERGASATVWFSLDCTASMRQEENDISKLDYARWLTASLGYLAVHQGDAIGLELISTDGRSVLQPARDPQHLWRFLIALENAQAAGSWPADGSPDAYAHRNSQREIAVLFTDLYEKENEILDYLGELQSANHDLLLFHLMGRRELEFDYEGSCCFEDLETGREVEVEAALVRDQYRAAMEKWLARNRQLLADRDVEYQLFTLEQPLEFALRSFLLRRLNASCSI